MLWKLIGGAGVLALLAFLVWIYGNSREHGGKLEERVAWQEAVRKRDAEIARLNLENANASAKGIQFYADKIAGMAPAVLRSTNTVERFAQTPAGAVACLGPDRVRGIEASAAELGFPIAAATGGPDQTLHANTH